MKTVMKTVMKSLIPLLVVASAVAAVDVQKRVLNGKNCLDKEGEHFVVLLPPRSPQSRDIADRFCGGNLISQDWVLTAGHCNKSEFDVGLGYHGGQKGEKITITEESDKHIYNDGSDFHDIMLIKLPRNPSRKLPVIKLPTADQCKSFKFDVEYTIMGWSFTDVDKTTGIKDQKLAVKLQCGKAKMDQNCPQDPDAEDAQGNISKYKIKHSLCSKDVMPCNGCSKKPCESCPGDSGGSLVKKSDGVLYGVTVASYDEPTGFTRYMKVCENEYIDWIRKTTGIKEETTG